MGRKTYESIGRPLPGRTNIVITRGTDSIPGCVVVHSIEEALEEAQRVDRTEIFLFGGARVYEEGIQRADRLYLTLINESAPDADAFFPNYDAFSVITREEGHPEATPSYTWVTLDRNI